VNFIVIITVIVLIIMGVFHFYWSFGGLLGLDKALPTKDAKLLLNPSKSLTFLVGLVLIVFAFIAYSLQFHDLTTLRSTTLYKYSGLFISILFILRAVGEFNAVGFFKKIKDTEFAIYDTKYFSPLCLGLGIVFTMLTYKVFVGD
jgi:hypothetical protein